MIVRVQQQLITINTPQIYTYNIYNDCIGIGLSYRTSTVYAYYSKGPAVHASTMGKELIYSSQTWVGAPIHNPLATLDLRGFPLAKSAPRPLAMLPPTGHTAKFALWLQHHSNSHSIVPSYSIQLCIQYRPRCAVVHIQWQETNRTIGPAVHVRVGR